MMNQILIISPQFVKDNFVLADNIEDKKIEAIAIQAQKKYLEPILGTVLYRKVISDISTNVLSGDYKILVDEYLLQVLLNWTMYELLPYIHYNLTNKSIVTKQSENSTAVGLSDVKWLRDSVKDTAEYMSERATDYLRAYKTLYPEFGQNSAYDEIRPNMNNYTSNIYFGSNKVTCRRSGDDFISLN